MSRRNFQYRVSGSLRIPDDWRDRLPDPTTYFGQHVAKLNKANAAGWAKCVCPFHDDSNASLSVHIAGGWHCFAGCGGGDMLGFHQRITGKDFRDAVRDLLALR
jgi:DNA primase